MNGQAGPGLMSQEFAMHGYNCTLSRRKLHLVTQGHMALSHFHISHMCRCSACHSWSLSTCFMSKTVCRPPTTGCRLTSARGRRAFPIVHSLLRLLMTSPSVRACVALRGYAPKSLASNSLGAPLYLALRNAVLTMFREAHLPCDEKAGSAALSHLALPQVTHGEVHWCCPAEAA